jgi:hypothetical protein
LVHSSSRGGLELAVFEPNHINTQNPALLANSRLAIFETNVYYKHITNRQDSLKSKDSDGNINAAFMAFPIAKFWSTAVGFNNYSKIGYEYKSFQTVGNTNINRTYDGFGAINQVHLMNGIKIYKGFNIGFTASYTFGNISNFDVTFVSPTDNIDTRISNALIFNKELQISTFTFKTGAFYRGKINENYSFNIGATYTPKRSFSSDYSAIINKVIYTSSPPLTTSDTINSSSQNISIPEQLQVGFVLEKNKKWLIGVDYSSQQWSNLVIGNNNMGLKNNTRITIGGEYTPNYQSTTSYFSRCNYKAGIRYEKTPLFVNQTQINNIGINFGLELPTDRLRSFINLGFEIGKRGTLNNDLIRENYFGINFGLTLNDRWFLKRRIN